MPQPPAPLHSQDIDCCIRGCTSQEVQCEGLNNQFHVGLDVCAPAVANVAAVANMAIRE